MTMKAEFGIYRTASQVMPKTGSKTSEAGEGKEGFPCRLQRKCGHAYALVSGSRPLHREIPFCVCKPPVCGTADLLYLWAPHLWIQPMMDRKYSF